MVAEGYLKVEDHLWSSSKLRGSPLLLHSYKKFKVPQWLSAKEPAFQHRRLGFEPWVGKIPWRGKWQPAPVFLLRQSQGQRSLAGYRPWSPKESDMAEWLNNNEETQRGLKGWFCRVKGEHFSFWSLSYLGGIVPSAGVFGNSLEVVGMVVGEEFSDWLANLFDSLGLVHCP